MTVTTDDVRDELPVDEGAFPHLDTTGFDELLETLIERETERVESQTDSAVGTETTTVRISRPEHVDGHLLPLDARPVQSVASVTVDDDTVDSSDYLVEETHLELLPDASLLSWPTRRRSVTVEYTYGFPADGTPAPVDGAIIGLVRQAVVDVESGGVTQESIAGDNVSYAVPDDVVARHVRRAREHVPEFRGGAQVI